MFRKNIKRGIALSSNQLSWVEIKVDKKEPELLQFLSKKLPEGLIKPHFGKENISDKNKLRALIIETLPEEKSRGDIALTLPDHLAKISLLKFDEVPDKKEELKRLILWRLKKKHPIVS